MLNFILGGAKSGKSYNITEQITKLSDDITKSDIKYPNEQIILIVPEQFAYEAERALFEHVGSKSFLNIKVTSFSRIASEIFYEYGGTAGTYADDCTKIIFMKKAINLSFSNDNLDVYQKASKYADLTTKMISTIDELKMAGVTYSALSEINITENAYLQKKITEISSIYTDYENIFASKNYINATDDISRAIKLVQDNENEFFKDKHIFIDEFKGFTTVEYKFLENLMLHAKELHIALCMDSNRLAKGQLSPFASIEITKNDIVEIAKDKGVKINEITLTNNYYNNEALKYLEKHVLSHKPTAYSGSDAKDSISMMACGNEYEELEYVLATINRLVQSGNYKYNDMAIISRDMSTYDSIFEGVFSKYDVPVYYDPVTSVTEKPLIRFVMSFLNCIVSGVNAENILAMLKCELVPFSFYDITTFENYIFEWNITKISDWKKPFTLSVAGTGAKNTSKNELHNGDVQFKTRLDKINEVREYCIVNIEKFKKAIAKVDTTGVDFSRAVMQTVIDMNIKEKIEKRIRYLYWKQPEKIEKAEEYTRVWEIFNELLSTIGNTVGSDPITAKEFSDLFNLVASTYDMGSVQQVIDCVILGSADRIRTTNKKVVFVLGVNDTIFPFTPKNNTLLSTRERNLLKAENIAIPNLGIDQIKDERFIAYSTLTSATEKLYITHLKGNIKGEPLLPSTIISDLENIFGSEISKDINNLSLGYFSHNSTTALKELLLTPNSNKEKANLKQHLEKDIVVSTKLKHLQDIKDKKGFVISNTDIAIRLFHEHMVISPSKIETFAKCPFMYYCLHGIKAEPLKRLKLNAMNSGSLIHDVLENILKSPEFTDAIDSTKKIPLDEKAIKTNINTEINSFVERELGGEEFKTERFLYLYQRMEKSIFDIVERLYGEFLTSKFRPYKCEATIGGEEFPDFAPLVLTRDTGETVTIRGKVDRVDSYTDSNMQKYIRIIDYKSGSKQFKLNDVFNGINTQMLIYLQATVAGALSGSEGVGEHELANSKPAGILYMPVGESGPQENEFDEVVDAEKIKETYLSGLQMNGLIVNEPADIYVAMEDYNDIETVAKTTSTVTRHNKYIPKLKLDSKESSLINPVQLEAIDKYINTQILGMSEKLHKGEIFATPLRLSTKESDLPCEYCDYSSICGNKGSSNQVITDYVKFTDNAEIIKNFFEDNIDPTVTEEEPKPKKKATKKATATADGDEAPKPKKKATKKATATADEDEAPKPKKRATKAKTDEDDTSKPKKRATKAKTDEDELKEEN